MNSGQSRAGRLVGGAGALLALTLLVVGVPLGLVHAVGWPLPHQLPTIAGLRIALTTRGIPDQTWLDALACVAWLVWASVVLSIAEEVVAVVRGRPSRRLLLARAFQPLAARLVAAVVFATLLLARPQLTTSPPAALALQLSSQPPAASLADMVLPVPNPSAAGSTVASTTPSTYTVVRHDTLWSIAQTLLGDPLRWRELFALNEGRLQPDGRALTDPSWIYPGWVLVLPVHAAAPPAPAPPAASAPSPPAPDPAPPVPTSAAPSTTAEPVVTPNGAARSSASNRSAERATRPIVLPSGSVIAPSFAAGVLAAVTVGRLRRRRRYQPSDPRPGRDLRPPSLSPALSDLRRATVEQTSVAETPYLVGDSASPPDTEPILRTTAATCVAGPDRPVVVEIGTKNEVTVSLDLSSIGALSVSGPVVHDVVRASCAALLTSVGPGAVEVLMSVQLAATLFPGLGPTGAFRTVGTEEVLLRCVEAESIGRSRRLAEDDLPDAASYRAAHPEDPLPFLVVIVDQVPDALVTRWRAVCESTGPLDVAVLVLGDYVPDTSRIVIETDYTVSGASPDVLDKTLGGASLFRLGPSEGSELVGQVVASRGDGPEGDDPKQSLEPPAPEAAESECHEGWPPEPERERPTVPPPIEVRLLGPYRVTAHGSEVSKGLRSAAKELLAWFLLRPEGATAEAAVDALWPDTTPELVTKRFWRALGDLRSRLRHDGAPARPDVLIRSGDHYRPEPGEISCDLWEFQRHLDKASRAVVDDEARVALRAAVDLYQGDFADGADYLWVAPVREDLHRRALDAHLRLAELEEATDRYDSALAVLQHAIQLDPVAEEAFRRLMTLEGRIGRRDSLAATWRLLQRNLAELELDPEPATVQLYGQLRGGDRLPGTVTRIGTEPRTLTK